MNQFGRIFKLSIYGESHGSEIGIIIDGCPPGLPLSPDMFEEDMSRRKGGQKGTTPRVEDDLPLLCSGVFKGKTTGAPILIRFENRNVRSEDYEKQRDIPRPGHVDWVAHQKFSGFEDYRGGGHFSARLTAGLVAAGVVAKKLLGAMKVEAKIIEVGGEQDIDSGLSRAIEAKDTIGGVVECRVSQVPVGLGAPFFDSLESMLAHILFAIPAVKGLEFGAGFESARMFGSQHNDPILDASGKTASNNNGGILGGLSTGNELIFRVAIKPASSTPHPQKSYNWSSKKVEVFSIKGRHDLCVALRAPVIVEAAAAIVLADFLLLSRADKLSV